MRDKMTGKANFTGLQPKWLLMLFFCLSYLIVVISACSSETPTPTPTPVPAPSPAPSPAPTPAPPTASPASGTVEDGKDIFISKACTGCHTIQGIPEAQGKVGPELTHQASNSLIVDILPNTEENLKEYLKDPAAAKPGALMPNQYLTDIEIEALVAFLRTLK